MYEWVTHTWNTIRGECPHGCHYCYMKRWGIQKPIRFVPSELKTDLGIGNTIFVGSSCDMFAAKNNAEWIHQTLDACRASTGNRYLFQSKNPGLIYELRNSLPKDVIVGTTIESQRWWYEMGESPHPLARAKSMLMLRNHLYKTMITIEPVMDFNTGLFEDMIKAIKPDWVNIGANTIRKVKLQEPSPEKVKDLIGRLEDFTEVKVKPNLNRLLK